MIFQECPYCGCYLDPGEKCDCREEKNRYAERIAKYTKEERDGQMVMTGEVRYARTITGV